MRFPALVLALLLGCASQPVAQADVVGPVLKQLRANEVGPIDELMLLDLSERIAQAEPGDFHLYFKSPGGSIFDGLEFLGLMERAQARGVRFVCTAELAASMGAVLYSACDDRIALPRAIFMIHSGSVDSGGNAREQRETADALEAISDALFRQLCKVLNISFEELKRRAGDKDYWLDSQRALEIGLVQRISP